MEAAPNDRRKVVQKGIRTPGRLFLRLGQPHSALQDPLHFGQGFIRHYSLIPWLTLILHVYQILKSSGATVHRKAHPGFVAQHVLPDVQGGLRWSSARRRKRVPL